MPAKVQNNFNTNKLINKIMKKSILKKATLKNSGMWTTTITWYSLGGKTQIVIEKRYERDKNYNYTKVEEFSKEEFEEAYNTFHQLIKEWI